MDKAELVPLSKHPLSELAIADYLLGFYPPQAAFDFEEHYFACKECGSRVKLANRNLHPTTEQ